MWRALRIGVLLLILLIVGGQAWLDRVSTTGWQRTVFVGAFPVAADASAVTARYVSQLRPGQIDEVDAFLATEAHRYGIRIDEPVRVQLYPMLSLAPPALAPGAGALARLIWSLRLRIYRYQALRGVAPRPAIALFLLYHDPTVSDSLPHSAGLQRGLTAVVHVFASGAQEPQNRIVLAHELLHTFGATDKYDPMTGQPLYPSGFADPERTPRYPQSQGEIMAGRVPTSPTQAQLPYRLTDERVGPQTAQEIGWLHP